MEAQARAAVVSNVDYDLIFELSASEKNFSGSVEMQFDLSRTAEALFVDFAGGRVESLSINGSNLKPEYDGRRLRLPHSALKTGRNTVRVVFEHEYSSDGSGLHRFVDPADQKVYLYTDLQPFESNRVFPNFDQPDLKARYRIQATAPKDWEIVTYALPLTNELRGEKRAWSFPWSARFSTYIFSLHAGPYRIWKSQAGKIALRLLARESLADRVDAAEWLLVTQQGFKFFEKYFGSEYPFGKYDQIIVPEFNAGAMENVGAVTFSEWNVFRSKATLEQRESRADVILHEMAHMWFGNLVTMRWWDGLWLNESFATYMASLALIRATEFKGAWRSFYSSTKNWAYWSDELVTTHPIQTPVANTNEAFANFDGITYGKGAASLKQLHFLLGEEDFQKGIQLYFKRHAYQNTEIQDFIAALEESSGRSLAKWVDDWLMTAGLNTLKAQWACENEKLAKIEILQSAPKEHPTLREHQTRVAFLSDSRAQLRVGASETLNFTGAQSTHPLRAQNSCPAAVYPNYEDHAYAKVALDPVTLKVAQTRLAQIEDPWLRNMMAQSLWDMVRDGSWDLSSYLQVVYKYLPLEKDEQSTTAAMQALRSAGAYLTRARALNPTENLIGHELALEEFLFKQIYASAQGSDAQAHYFEALVDFARSPQGVLHLRSWLDGKKLPKGLSLGQDRRWLIIKQLNLLGVEDSQARIESELQSSSDDFAQKAALSSRARRPDPLIKAELWSRLLEGKDSLALQKQIMWSLFPADQSRLHEKWADEYFRILPKLAKNRDEEFLSAFVEGLVPATCTSVSVQRLSNFLKRHGKSLSHSVRKELKIALQEDERCVSVLKKATF